MTKTFVDVKWLLMLMNYLLLAVHNVAFAEESRIPLAKENQNCKYGEINYHDGGLYKGLLRDGRKEGWGIYEYPNKQRYEGEWLNDKKHGLGILLYPSGNIWKGEWKNGKQNGRGVLIFADKGVFSGGFWEDGELAKAVPLTEEDKNKFVSIIDDLQKKRGGTVKSSPDTHTQLGSQVSPCLLDKFDSEERLVKILKEKGVKF